MSYKEKIDPDRLPGHIGIIMDGNGRWAMRRGEMRVFGHQNGVNAVKEVTEACAELGVKYLTLYAFSTENWSRPSCEVNALMSLLVSTLNTEIKTLQDNNIKLDAIGELECLSEGCYPELMHAIEQTANNDRMTLILALSYSSRWELARAARSIAQQVQAGKIQPDEINQELFSSFLTTSGIPDPELLIRTSGEYRISNFMLWQIAYAELYFTPVLWPDFGKEDLYEAIVDYQSRERRFGMTSEQIKVL